MSEVAVASMEVQEIKGSARMSFLQKHLHLGVMGAIVAENTVYHTMGEICEEYHGGYWNFFRVSNGAIFMAPKHEGMLQLAVAGNFFEGALTPEGTGVTVTLMALSELSFRYEDNETIAERFYQLREYAGTREDAGDIFRAID